MNVLQQLTSFQPISLKSFWKRSRDHGHVQQKKGHRRISSTLDLLRFQQHSTNRNLQRVSGFKAFTIWTLIPDFVLFFIYLYSTLCLWILHSTYPRVQQTRSIKDFECHFSCPHIRELRRISYIPRWPQGFDALLVPLTWIMGMDIADWSLFDHFVTILTPHFSFKLSS